MSNVAVSVRFRPLSQSEKAASGENSCIQLLDAESFLFKDEKGQDATFCFDRVFYQDSQQVEVYDFLLKPIIEDAVKAINGTIITYGQTGAGKTYSMEGLGILDSDENNKGLLARFVDGLFGCLNEDSLKCSVKLSMVEIYMEKVRDLLDLAKDNIQIKESKTQGIFLSGATEICITSPSEALHWLSQGIANRALGETRMNMASSRSHCLYMFLVQHESATNERLKSGKVVLVDLAGSEKVEKTGASGVLLDEAKSINKSLSALGNVINALTNGKMHHIPYRDSRLTRILQDALGGNCRASLLCCCSPSPSNAPETLSTLRFGSRAKLIKNITETQTLTPARERIYNKIREKLNEDYNRLLDELSTVEGLDIDPHSTEDLLSTIDHFNIKTVQVLQTAVVERDKKIEEMMKECDALNYRLADLKYKLAVKQLVPNFADAATSSYSHEISHIAISCLVVGFLSSLFFFIFVSPLR